MTESYNTTYMQMHLIDRGTTVPASLRVFTPDALFQAQFKFTSGSARPDLTFNGSPLMEGRQMNDARFSIRAQAPAAVQFLFDSSSVFCVGGDLSTSLSALSLSLRGHAGSDSGPMICVPAHDVAFAVGWRFVPAVSVVITVQSDWMRVRSFLDSVVSSRGTAQPKRTSPSRSETWNRCVGGSGFLNSGRALRL